MKRKPLSMKRLTMFMGDYLVYQVSKAPKAEKDKAVKRGYKDLEVLKGYLDYVWINKDK